MRISLIRFFTVLFRNFKFIGSVAFFLGLLTIALFYRLKSTLCELELAVDCGIMKGIKGDLDLAVFIFESNSMCAG